MGTWIFNGDGTVSFDSGLGPVTINQEYLNNSYVGQDVVDISTDNPNYHEYSTTYNLGYSTDQVDLEMVQEALAEYPTPTSQAVLSPRAYFDGLGSFAGPGWVSHHSTGPNSIVNVTTDLHLLDPGVVQREIVVIDGQYHIRTTGIGIGIQPQANVNLAGQVWGVADILLGTHIAVQTGIQPTNPGHVSINGETVGTECFGPETPIDMWPLDPEFTPDPSNPNKVFDQDAVRAKIWKKPIAMIRKGDVVVSFDKNDNLMPGRVTRTFENESKILLDYFGTRVTPGHVYFRPDSKKTDKFECLLDILRDDGMIQNVEGKNIRAATNVPVGDPRDGFVWAITQERKDGTLVEKERTRIRLGTRFIVDGNTSQCVADVIAAKGGIIGDDELIRFDDAEPAPFVWEHGTTLPKPEDFVLQASGTTVADIYKAGEWETRLPHMPAPMVMDGGPVRPLSATARSAMARNQPLNPQPAAASAPVSKRTARQPMNRKQRKAMEAKLRKTNKRRADSGAIT